MTVEELETTPHIVTVARGKRGRFVKRKTAQRHPDRTTTESVERE